GANTYTGTTAILGGTLLVDGSLSPYSNVSVGDGTVLGGTGVAEGTISVERATTPTVVNAPAGNTLIEVSPQAENLDNSSSGLTVNGNGSDQLIVNDQASTHMSDWQVDATSMAQTYILSNRSGSFLVTRTINYSNVGNLTINAGQYGNTITLSPTAHNLDELPHTVSTSQGSVTINGGGTDALILKDQNDPSPLFGYEITDRAVT